MNKNVIIALGIIAVLVIMLIFNRGNVDIDLLFTEFKAMKSLAFFGFTCIGVIIGLLLK